MKKLENILAENMLRFGTKNLHEANLDDLEKILGFDGSNRDPKTGNLMNQDADQDNTGYPDDTEGSATTWTPGQPGRYTQALLSRASEIMNGTTFNSLKDAYAAMSAALRTNPNNEDEIRNWIAGYAKYGKY